MDLQPKLIKICTQLLSKQYACTNIKYYFIRINDFIVLNTQYHPECSRIAFITEKRSHDKKDNWAQAKK